MRGAFAWEENVANRCQQHVLSLSQTPQIKALRSDKCLYQQTKSDSLWTVNNILWVYVRVVWCSMYLHDFYTSIHTYTSHTINICFFNDISMLYIFVVIESAAFYVSIPHLQPFFGKLPYSYFLQIFPYARIR